MNAWGDSLSKDETVRSAGKHPWMGGQERPDTPSCWQSARTGTIHDEQLNQQINGVTKDV